MSQLKIRVYFFDAQGKRQNERIPASFCRDWENANLGAYSSARQFNLYRGHQIVKGNDGKFRLAPIAQPLPKRAYVPGLAREFARLQTQLACLILHRMSLVPYLDGAQFCDRPMSLEGSL